MRPAEYELMYRVEEAHWWYQALHALIFHRLATHLPGWRERAILDAGCGTGAVLQRLGNPRRHVGVDRSPDALRFCRQRGLPNVVQADVAALPFADRRFDAVICSSVLYHRWVGDVGAALDELIRVLRPGGFLLVNLPAYGFLRSAHDEAVFGARRFTRGELRRWLAGRALAIRELTYWTTLLFPFACVARTFGVAKTGRDFAPGGRWSPINGILTRLMRVELACLKTFSLPFGVALLGVAQKTDAPR
jgi:SAM-dependent methyltransferase